MSPAAASASPGTDWPETQCRGPLHSHVLRRLHFDAERQLIEQALVHRFIRVALDVLDVPAFRMRTRHMLNSRKNAAREPRAVIVVVIRDRKFVPRRPARGHVLDIGAARVGAFAAPRVAIRRDLCGVAAVEA